MHRRMRNRQTEIDTKAKCMTDKHHQRFELSEALPDMKCGTTTDQLKGIIRVRFFSPTHFTADWAGGVLVQVRLWGPQILDDGSLGERKLDYRWKKTRLTGPVRYSDLPPTVACRLRSYNAERGLRELADPL